MHLIKLCLSALLAGYCLSANATIMLEAAPDTHPKLTAEVQRTIDSFNAIASEELGVTLDKNVFIRLCPSEVCYVNALRNDAGYSYDKAQLTGRVSGGTTFPDKRLILLNILNPSGLPFARAVVAHELTHMLQSQIAGDIAYQRSNRWIKEGMADWMGALVSNKLGSESIEKWRLDRINRLRAATNPLAPGNMDEVSFEQWTHWMDEKRLPYEMVDLMMMSLAEQKGSGIFKALVAYFGCVQSFSFESTCFKNHFGIAQRDFYAKTETDLKNALVGGKALELIAAEGIPPESVRLVENAFAQSQTLLQENFESDLPITFRIFLLPDTTAMSSAIAHELGRSSEEADKLAKGTSSLWQDSLMFLDLSRLNTAERLASTTASAVTGRYLQLIGREKGKFRWLNMGLRDYVAIATLDALRLRTEAESTQQRTEALNTASKGLPALAELQTLDAYRKAASKYGNTVVAQYSATAVRLLIAENGAAALGNWVLHSKTAIDPQTAFTAIFGETTNMSTETLNTRVKDQIAKNNL
jgi:hypothetical protein